MLSQIVMISVTGQLFVMYIKNRLKDFSPGAGMGNIKISV